MWQTRAYYKYPLCCLWPFFPFLPLLPPSLFPIKKEKRNSPSAPPLFLFISYILLSRKRKSPHQIIFIAMTVQHQNQPAETWRQSNERTSSTSSTSISSLLNDKPPQTATHLPTPKSPTNDQDPVKPVVDKPFVCNQCDQSFSRSHNLKSHLATHSPEKPFQVWMRCSIVRSIKPNPKFSATFAITSFDANMISSAIKSYIQERDRTSVPAAAARLLD